MIKTYYKDLQTMSLTCHPTETRTTVIRDALPEDAPWISALMEELGYPMGMIQVMENLASFSRDPGKNVLVAQEDQRVIGVIAMTTESIFHLVHPVARIVSMCVAGDCRERGIGKALIRSAMEKAGEDGCIEVELTSNIKRKEAHAFYTRMGFDSTHRYFVSNL